MRASVEFVLLVGVLLVFSRVHDSLGQDVTAATDNARALQSVERALHLDIELSANQWLVSHPALIDPAVIVYRTYYAVLISVLVWVFLRHRLDYPYVRSIFVAMTGLALIVYWALPMSPPRFALVGIVDVVAQHDLLGRTSSVASNGFSAMPSLHVGWSAWAAYAVWYSLRRTHRRRALLAWVLPIAMVAVVFGTGNHYVLDVVGSVVLLIASIALARAWGRVVETTRRRRSPRRPRS